MCNIGKIEQKLCDKCGTIPCECPKKKKVIDIYYDLIAYQDKMLLEGYLSNYQKRNDSELMLQAIIKYLDNE